MNRGRRGEPVFRGRGDYSSFVDLLKETCEAWNGRVAAYCLMPNHYHLLLQTPEANISRCMRHVDGVYTQRFNRNHDCDGPLFRGRYKAILVDADRYLLELVRYIHRNPLSAGLTERLGSYPWSSHRGYLSRARTWDWLHKDYVLGMLATKEADRLRLYREFVSLGDSQDLLEVFSRKRLPWVLGSEGFVAAVKERFFGRKLNDEVPESRELAPDVNKIKRAVCEFYRIEEAELLVSRRGSFNEARNVAIYLTRRLRRDRLKEIGESFKVNTYSSVSSVVERLKAALTTDRRLRQRVEGLIRMIDKSQGQT
jgi:REP element-mobilizing transposase RayT